MENLDFIDQLKTYTETENVISVGKDVSELRSKLEDYLLEEERKIQVAEIEADNNQTAVDEAVTNRKEEITNSKIPSMICTMNTKQKRRPY